MGRLNFMHRAGSEETLILITQVHTHRGSLARRVTAFQQLGFNHHPVHRTALLSAVFLEEVEGSLLSAETCGRMVQEDPLCQRWQTGLYSLSRQSLPHCISSVLYFRFTKAASLVSRDRSSLFI